MANDEAGRLINMIEICVEVWWCMILQIACGEFVGGGFGVFKLDAILIVRCCRQIFFDSNTHNFSQWLSFTQPILPITLSYNS